MTIQRVLAAARQHHSRQKTVASWRARTHESVQMEKSMSTSTTWDRNRSSLDMVWLNQRCRRPGCTSLEGERVLFEARQHHHWRTVPKVIWLTHGPGQDVPKHVWENLRQYAHRFEVRRQDDSACLHHLQILFEPIVSHVFESLKGPHRADLWRYAMLYLFGGVYLDIDMKLTVPLQQVFTAHNAWYTVLQPQFCPTVGCKEGLNNSLPSTIYQVSDTLVPADLPERTDVRACAALCVSTFQGMLATPAGNSIFAELLTRMLYRREVAWEQLFPPTKRDVFGRHLTVLAYLDFVRDFYFVLHQRLKRHPRVGHNDVPAGELRPILFGMDCQPGFPEYKYHLCCSVHHTFPAIGNELRDVTPPEQRCAGAANRSLGEVIARRWPVAQDPTTRSMAPSGLLDSVSSKISEISKIVGLGR